MEQLGMWGSMIPYRVLGFIFLAVSLVFFIKPEAMVKLDAQGRRLMWRTYWTLRYRIISGFFFLAISLALVRVGFFMPKGGVKELGLLTNPLFYFILGGILFLAAIGYFFAPGVMKKMHRLGTSPLGTTPIAYGFHPNVMGACFLIAGLFLLYVGFFVV